MSNDNKVGFISHSMERKWGQGKVLWKPFGPKTEKRRLERIA
jgi:hypothetical protein